MRTTLWVAALLIGALALTNAADAGIFSATIDFNTDTSPGSLPSNYADNSYIAAAFGVYDDTDTYLRELQVMDARDFYQASGGVAADDDLEGDKDTNWGQVTLALTNPDNLDITLDSFLLCQYDNPFSTELILTQDDYPDLFVKILYDATEVAYSYWDLFDGDGLTLVTPDPQVFANSIKIQWSYPYNLAIDDIAYTVVPEPATLVSWALGLVIGLVGYRRYRRMRG